MEPVKWMPARAGCGSTAAEVSGPCPGSRLITPGRQAGLLEQPHRGLGGQQLGGGRLPDHGVAHQRRRGRQVARDRGEVERGDRVDEALQRPVVGAVPDPGHRDRLAGQDLPGEVHVPAPEVDELADRVDLGLEHGLGLAEHRQRVAAVPPRPGQQVGGAQEDGGPRVERELPPGRRGLQGGVDRGRGVGLGRAPSAGQHQVVPVRRGDDELVAGAGALLTVHGEGDLDGLRGGGLQRLFDPGPLRRTGGIGQDGLVARLRYGGDGVHMIIVTRHMRRTSRITQVAE